jgi:hypothetical protein
MILNDWQRGKIPFFVRPPETEKVSKMTTMKIHFSAPGYTVCQNMPKRLFSFV